VKGEWRKLHNKDLKDVYPSSNIVHVINREERDRRGMWVLWGRGESYTGFRCGNLKERDHLGDEA